MILGRMPNYGNDQIRAALTQCSIYPMRRAETLDIDEFITLADIFLILLYFDYFKR